MKRKSVVSVITAVVLSVFLLAVHALALEEGTPTTGECGPDAVWSYASESKTLTISGSGAVLQQDENRNYYIDWYVRNEMEVVRFDGMDIDSIGNYAFSECSNLTSISIPEGVTSIGERAFSECSSLTSISIPEGVTSIGGYAFYKCSSLASISLPEGVTSIEHDAFEKCENLSHITLPASLTGCPFWRTGFLSECPKLISAGPAGDGEYSITYNWTTAIPEGAFSQCSSLTEVAFPNTIKTIGDSAFCGTGLTQVTIPESVTSIGSDVFDSCSRLKEIHIPASLIRINDTSFGGCTNLETITVDPNNKIYASQDGALFSKEKATLYRVPQTKTSFTIPESVTKIENSAFRECSSLTKLIIPDSVKSFSCDFWGCTALTELTLPGLSDIDAPNLTTVRITEGTDSLYRTFSDLTTLTTVYLPASLNKIDSNTFSNCYSLETVYFAGTQAQWDTMTIADGNQELSLAAVICTGTEAPPPDTPDTPDTPTDPVTPGPIDMTVKPGGLGKRLTLQIQSGHWLTVQTRRAGSIAISSLQAPGNTDGTVSITFSAPTGSIVQVWETEDEMMFENGIPSNPILNTTVREL